LLGLLAAPITLTWGPVASANVLTTLSIAASGFTAFWVARNFSRSALAGLCAGVIMIVVSDSGDTAQLGHLNILAFFLPALMLLVAKRVLVDRVGRPWAWGLVLGALLVLQFMISTEIFADVVVLTAVSLVVCLVLFPRRSWHTAGRALQWLGSAAALTGVALAWPVWEAVHGPWHVTGLVHQGPVGLGVSVDRVVSPAYSKVTIFCYVSGLRHCSPYLLNGGLGKPLIALGILAVIITWRNPLARYLSVMVMISFVLALGAHLLVHANILFLTKTPMPEIVLTRLPLLKNISPARFMRFVALLLALVIAMAIGQTLRWSGHLWHSRTRPAPAGYPWPGRVAGACLAAVSLVVLAPIAPKWPYHQTRVSCPAFFRTSSVERVPAGTVALTYPFPSDFVPKLPWSQGMLWQACSHMRFALVGGYVLVPTRADGQTSTFLPLRHSFLGQVLSPPGSLGPQHTIVFAGPVVQILQHQPGARQDLAHIARQLAALRVNDIFVWPRFPGGPDVAAVFTQLLHRPPVAAGGILYWLHVQHALAHRPT